MADEIARGNYAARMLEDPMFQEIFATIRANQYAAWMNSPVRDTEGREKIWQFTKMLDNVKTALEVIRDNGLALEAKHADDERQQKFNQLNHF